MVSDSRSGDLEVHSQGQDRDRMGRGGQSKELLWEHSPEQRRTASTVPLPRPILGHKHHSTSFQATDLFPKKKKNNAQPFSCFYGFTQRTTLLPSSTCTLPSTFRLNLPISKERRRYARIRNDLVSISRLM